MTLLTFGMSYNLIHFYYTLGEMLEKDKQDDVSDTIKEEYLQEIVERVTRSSEEAHFQYLQKDAGAKIRLGDGHRSFNSFSQRIKYPSATFNWL